MKKVEVDRSALRPDLLAKRPLTLAAIVKGQVIADRRFEPGATVSVGSNSGCSLVIPEKLELTAYTLLTGGATLNLLPPLHVKTTVWWQDAPLELNGHFRDLRKRIPGLEQSLPLASDRFIVSYSSGVAFIGRFEL